MRNFNPRICFLAAALLLTLPSCLFISTSNAASKSSEAAPNFVVILTDDQSWVGSSLQMVPDDARTKSDYYQTPHIERLANAGMIFSQAYAPAAKCNPTRRALQIGQTPARHLYHHDRLNWQDSYRKQLTIPRMLKAADSNYRTAHFGKWDMRHDNVTPEELGYDVSDGYTGNATGKSKGSGGPAVSTDPKLIEAVTQRAIDFMGEQQASGKPFYVQLSHYAVHLDIYYRQETLEKTERWSTGQKHSMPEFAAMTSDLDNGIGKLLDFLHTQGLSDNTYLFFLSDNGGRRKMPGQKTPELPRNHPLRGAKSDLYEGGIRVPFIVAGPGVSEQVTNATPITGLDILPTIADLAGYSQPLPAQLDGGSLRPVFTNDGVGTVSRNKNFLFFHQAIDEPAMTALISGDYKLVKTEDAGLELFNLSNDLSEKNNLSDSSPKKVAELAGQMESFLVEIGAETKSELTKKEKRKKSKKREQSK